VNAWRLRYQTTVYISLPECKDTRKILSIYSTRAVCFIDQFQVVEAGPWDCITSLQTTDTRFSSHIGRPCGRQSYNVRAWRLWNVAVIPAVYTPGILPYTGWAKKVNRYCFWTNCDKLYTNKVCFVRLDSDTRRPNIIIF